MIPRISEQSVYMLHGVYARSLQTKWMSIYFQRSFDTLFKCTFHRRRSCFNVHQFRAHFSQPAPSSTWPKEQNKTNRFSLFLSSLLLVWRKHGEKKKEITNYVIASVFVWMKFNENSNNKNYSERKPRKKREGRGHIATYRKNWMP